MKRAILIPFMLTTLVALGACDGSKPAGGGNVSMRDMEVVDGTANDSMADLDNAASDGTLFTNMGGLPPVGAVSKPSANASEPTSNAAAPATNSSAPN